MPTTMLKAIGLMSGTSLDGIDAALLVSDGKRIESIGPGITVPYHSEFRDAIREVIAGKGNKSHIQQQLTQLHAQAVGSLLQSAELKASDIDVIGFHGQTILHQPEKGITVQLGDGKLLAELTGINVVNDFRTNDVRHGGQGAPLVPLYHEAIVKEVGHPVALVNIGGVANVTWVGPGEENLLAFDTGPGNAMIDDWVLQHTGKSHDEGGKIAAAGKVNKAVLERFLSHAFFALTPPKSLDRNHFVNSELLNGLSLEDGAATLTAFTVESIAKAREYFPKPVKRWFITGGGRHNATMMSMLAKAIKEPVEVIEALGYSGDMLEAQAFAFLAIRSLKKLPLSLPTTTGVKHSVSGGVFCPALNA